MEMKLLLALPEEFEVESLNLMEKTLLIDTVSTQKNPCCPLCGIPASRVHSRYLRRVADVPSGGQCVCLILPVRKFFCDETTCARKIFTERLAPLVERMPHAPRYVFLRRLRR